MKTRGIVKEKIKQAMDYKWIAMREVCVFT